LLCLRQIALKVAPFRQYVRASASRIPSNELLASGCSVDAAGLIQQARKNLCDILNSDDASLEAKNTLLAARCEGFGTRVVSFGNDASSSSANSSSSILVNNPISDFISETVQEVADDFRSKGAMATLKDATIDVADLLVDGLEGLTGWMRQVIPPASSFPVPAPSTVPAPVVHDFSGYRQQRGDQFAALFGEPTENRHPPVSLAQSEIETAPNTPDLPDLPALLLDESKKDKQSFLD
jgi:hypothetical protein